MMLALLITLSVVMTTTILLASNPATLSIWLIITASMMATTIVLPSSSWFALILFLIYIGGMLVMFSYFVVIQPNQQLEMKKMMLATSLSTATLLLPHLSMELPSFSTSSPNTMNPFLLLLPNSFIILLLLASILFLILIAVVKISKIQDGPLRPFF
uniref:NADH dehydrogenase subunit 6 n=1 Tax=Marphysa sanguinea TaxID=167828 RepID=V5W4G9_MARSA|nr:NADH dehydrogenase subunit 6 [Marphysa sanguinea]AHC01835.1 NADH dehydrogenase subunit 6 [Marphysa sanguinea]